MVNDVAKIVHVCTQNTSIITAIYESIKLFHFKHLIIIISYLWVICIFVLDVNYLNKKKIII